MRLRIGICSGFEHGLKAVKFAQSAREVDSLKLAVKLIAKLVVKLIAKLVVKLFALLTVFLN